MSQQFLIESKRLKEAYYNALGSKSVVNSAALLPGFFPNDGKYKTCYNANVVGLLLDNLNMGDCRKKITFGCPRYDLWFTFIKKQKGKSQLDSR